LTCEIFSPTTERLEKSPEKEVSNENKFKDIY
jgi:hypothetical protein